MRVSSVREKRSESCVKGYFPFHPRKPNRRLFLILYSWSGQPVFPPELQSPKRPPPNLHTHREKSTHTCTSNDEVCPAVPCFVLPHVDYCRPITARSTRTSAPYSHTPRKDPCQHLSVTPLPLSPSRRRDRLVVAVAGLPVVPNQLPAADHLAHGEEAQHLGEQHAAPDDLRPREVPDLLDGRGRGRGAGGGAGGGPQKGLGVLDGVDRAVEVALDGGQGTT